MHDHRLDFSEVDQRYRADLETAIHYLQSKGCSEIYIFGSVGSGTLRQSSDIDIAVRGIKPEHFFAIYGDLMMQLQHNVDLVDLDAQTEFGKSLLQTGTLKRVA